MNSDDKQKDTESDEDDSVMADPADESGSAKADPATTESNSAASEAKDSTDPEPETEKPESAEPDAGGKDDAPDEVEPDNRGTAPTAPEQRPAKRGGALAFLALLLALAALAGTAWQWYQQPEPAGDDSAVDQQNQALEEQLTAVEAKIAELAARVDAGDADETDQVRTLARLERELSAQADLAAALPARLARVESAITSLPALSGAANREWQLSTAEHYIEVANARLLLAGEIDAAALALALADETIRSLADPALSQVRAALSDEIASLRSLPVPDVEGITLRLAALVRELPGLPMRQRAPQSLHEQNGAPEDVSGLERALAMLKAAFSRLVSIKRTDQPVSPLLTEEEQRVMASAIALDLQLASLAAMRGHNDLYAQTLRGVRNRFEIYFDVSAPEVMGAMFTLSELADTQLEYTLPDISGSLALLRQQRTLEADEQ